MQPLVTATSVFASKNQFVLGIYTVRLIQYVSLCVWLVLLSKMLARKVSFLRTEYFIVFKSQCLSVHLLMASVGLFLPFGYV